MTQGIKDYYYFNLLRRNKHYQFDYDNLINKIDSAAPSIFIESTIDELLEKYQISEIFDYKQTSLPKDFEVKSNYITDLGSYSKEDFLNNTIRSSPFKQNIGDALYKQTQELSVGNNNILLLAIDVNKKKPQEKELKAFIDSIESKYPFNKNQIRIQNSYLDIRDIDEKFYIYDCLIQNKEKQSIVKKKVFEKFENKKTESQVQSLANTIKKHIENYHLYL